MCDCSRKFTWTAFKFLWSCLFSSPWKCTVSTAPPQWEVNAPHKYLSTLSPGCSGPVFSACSRWRVGQQGPAERRRGSAGLYTVFVQVLKWKADGFRDVLMHDKPDQTNIWTFSKTRLGCSTLYVLYLVLEGNILWVGLFKHQNKLLSLNRLKSWMSQ